MKEHKLREYSGPDGLRVTLKKPEGKIKAKVKRVSEDGEDDVDAEVE